MSIRNVFILIFLLILSILDAIIGYCTIHFDKINILHFTIFLLINIGVAYGFTELLLSLIVKKHDPPNLDKLVHLPKVALLYSTFNDVLPDSLARLKNQTYENYDIYILDDSTQDTLKDSIDSFGYMTIRRENRKGFKAGALNNWLSLYGDNYEFFIISDADSLFEENFIERMVKYGEHPSNKNVSIFQSKIINWNNQSKFSRIMAVTTPLGCYFCDKLANECSTILSWGHNNLHRTKLIREVGGFDEAFTSEDYATSVHLISKGYACKVVDVISYEMVPETIQSYTSRNVRWAKQNLQLLKLDTGSLPFNTRLLLFMVIYFNLIWIVYGLGILLVIFGYRSTFDDLIYLIGIITGNPADLSKSSLIPLALFAFYSLNFTFMRLPLALKLGISVKDYCENLLLSMAVSNYAMYHIILAQLKTISGQKISFDVTDKGNNRPSFIDTLRDFKEINLFIILIIIGVLRNPTSLIFNFVWLIPLICSPFILYRVHEGTQASDYRSAEVSKLTFIEALRGLGSLSIIAFHLIMNQEGPLYHLLALGKTGVTLFFVVSGFIIYFAMGERIESNINFYFRRFFRVAPLFYIVSLLYILFFLKQQSVLSILSNATFSFNFFPPYCQSLVYAGWTLGVEVPFYILAPFIFTYINTIKRTIGAFILTAALSYVYIEVLPLLMPLRYIPFYSSSGFLSQLPIFFVGIGCYFIYIKNLEEIVHRKRAALLLTSLFLLLIYTAQITDFLPNCINGMAYGCLLLALALYPTKILINHITIFYGKISYSSYLIHMLITVFFLSETYDRINDIIRFSPLAFLACFLLTIAILTPIAYISYKLIEKNGIILGKIFWSLWIKYLRE